MKALLLLLSPVLISSVMKNSPLVTVDLTGRNLIQIKNRPAPCKHSITSDGRTKLMQLYEQEQCSTDACK